MGAREDLEHLANDLWQAKRDAEARLREAPIGVYTTRYDELRDRAEKLESLWLDAEDALDNLGR